MYGDFACTAAVAPKPRPTLPPAEVWADDSLTLITAGHTQIETLHRLFPVVLPFIDRALVADTGVVGGLDYLNSLGPKVRAFSTPTDPIDAAVRQVTGGWFMLLGNDQLPSQQSLENLRKLIEASEGGAKFASVEFLTNTVEVGEKIVELGPREPRVPVLFKWAPGMYVEDGVRLKGPVGLVAACDHFIYLIK